MVHVRNLKALHRAKSNGELLINLSKQYGFAGCYLFTPEASEGYIIETRFFNAGIGIEEDPATGTAAGAVAGLFGKARGYQ